MIWLLLACTAAPPAPQPLAAVERPARDDLHAHVDAALMTGSPGAWRLTVTIASPDTGCERYADWWEALDAQGALLYRRVLEHSHVDEQPFTRAGGPVAVGPDATVVVRAHMSDRDGYGDVLRGTASGGFARWEPPPGFGADVEGPKPPGCAY